MTWLRQRHAAAVTRAPAWLSVLRLCRIGAWFSPAADVLASCCVADMAWSVDVVRAMSASTLLYGAGMVWNDIADREVDATTRPERPLPSGALGLRFALALGATLLVGGLLLSPCRRHHALIAALILGYDFGSKRVPWLGVLVMGSLRALNLGTALAIAPGTDGVRTALLTASLCYGIYIVAVTVLGIFEDTRQVAGRAVAAIQTVPPLAAIAGIAAVQGGPWPAPALAAVPVLWFLRQNARTAHWDQQAIRRAMTRLLLGTMLYTALLAGSAGRWPEAGGIAVAIWLARGIARRIALT